MMFGFREQDENGEEREAGTGIGGARAQHRLEEVGNVAIRTLRPVVHSRCEKDRLGRASTASLGHDAISDPPME